jgi:hypothetical protein
VGLRVPLGFHGTADFAFGRAARPGEQYESTGPVTAPGEAMHGLAYRGQTVPAVLAMLRARHVTVARYMYLSGNDSICARLPRHIPRTWRVWGADPWAPQQVMLSVGPRIGPKGCSRNDAPQKARSGKSSGAAASGVAPSPSPTGR